MRVRRVPAESGTCHADLCGELTHWAPREGFENAVRGFCKKHADERDAELNASGGRGEVVLLSEWYRDTVGRVRRIR